MALKLAGRWTYRSYHNDPDPTVDPKWFVAELRLEQAETGDISGKLDAFDEAHVYDVSGKCWHVAGLKDAFGEHLLFSAEATGSTQQTTGHIYRYRGILYPTWSNGNAECPALVGTMIRARRPDNPALEGTVGSFIAALNANNTM